MEEAVAARTDAGDVSSEHSTARPAYGGTRGVRLAAVRAVVGAGGGFRRLPRRLRRPRVRDQRDRGVGLRGCGKGRALLEAAQVDAADLSSLWFVDRPPAPTRIRKACGRSSGGARRRPSSFALDAAREAQSGMFENWRMPRACGKRGRSSKTRPGGAGDSCTLRRGRAASRSRCPALEICPSSSRRTRRRRSGASVESQRTKFAAKSVTRHVGHSRSAMHTRPSPKALCVDRSATASTANARVRLRRASGKSSFECFPGDYEPSRPQCGDR